MDKQIKTTAANVRRFNTNLSTLDLAVIKQLGGEARNIGNICEISTDAAEELANVCRCSAGAAGGFNGFIYYSETVAFTLANRDEITARLREQIADGLFSECDGVISAVMSFNCLKTDDVQEHAELEEETALALFGNPEEYQAKYTGIVANALAWAALEETAFRLDGQEIAD